MWIPLFSSFCLFLQDTVLINHSASHSLHGYNFSCLHFCILKPLHLPVLSLSVGPSMLNPHRLNAFSFIHLFSWAWHILTSTLIRTQLDILCQTVVDVPLPMQPLCRPQPPALYVSLCTTASKPKSPAGYCCEAWPYPVTFPPLSLSPWHPSQSLLVWTGCRGPANALQNMMALAGMGP